jgi:hypothetical protein
MEEKQKLYLISNLVLLIAYAMATLVVLDIFTRIPTNYEEYISVAWVISSILVIMKSIYR